MVAAQVLGQQREQSLRERHADQLAVQLVHNVIRFRADCQKD